MPFTTNFTVFTRFFRQLSKRPVKIRRREKNEPSEYRLRAILDLQIRTIKLLDTVKDTAKKLYPGNQNQINITVNPTIRFTQSLQKT